MTQIDRWIEQHFNGQSADFPLYGREASIVGLSIENAIRAHVEWVDTWKLALKDRHGEDFQPENVCKDNLCYLGRWIHSIEKAYGELPQYQALKDAHAQFHVLTADIVRQHQSGDFLAAMSRARGELMQASKDIAHALVELRHAI